MTELLYNCWLYVTARGEKKFEQTETSICVLAANARHNFLIEKLVHADAEITRRAIIKSSWVLGELSASESSHCLRLEPPRR
jgi:hypothetical protein